MGLKVALLGIYHESNTFSPIPSTLEDFRNAHWLTGTAIREEYQQAHHEIGGMFEVLDAAGIEVVPVVFAEATPGGALTAAAAGTLMESMFAGLRKILPVDGCLVIPHGAGVAENIPDLDGYWLTRLRDQVGPGVPVIGTLDLHANISPQMAAAADVLIAYKRNPHLDQRERGKEAANLMIRVLKKEIRPVQRLVQVPLAVSIEQQFTDEEPCRSLYAFAEEAGRREGVLAVSIALGFPYADVAEMGTSVIVATDDDPGLAHEVAKRIGQYMLEGKERFIGRKYTVREALDRAKDLPKPVLLLDMGDNVGGGAPGNGLALLNALEERGDLNYFVCLYDPMAVGQVPPSLPSGEPAVLTVEGYDASGPCHREITGIVRLVDGKFRENSPRHGGQAHYNMGKTAILSTPEKNIVMFTSLRVPPFSLNQLTTFGIRPSEFDVVVAKGVIAPLAAYGPACASVIRVDTPGVTQADMTRFRYSNRRRPLFPFEDPVHDAGSDD